jgi:hypothetical protein
MERAPSAHLGPQDRRRRQQQPAAAGSGTMTSLELARRLIAHGANANARVTKRPPAGIIRLNFIGGTPFLLAARTADADYMRLLASLAPILGCRTPTSPRR